MREVRVTIASSGGGSRFFYMGLPKTREEVISLIERARPGSVTIEAEEEVPYGEVFWVVDRLRKLGITNINLAYRRER
ncbi:MAG: hypothetical protein DRI61_05965 [Chloroflexi bacterium]|nr:MAG: hypothetical protein DRI61_05965 [Chloroflexota bacterium]